MTSHLKGPLSNNVIIMAQKFQEHESKYLRFLSTGVDNVQKLKNFRKEIELEKLNGTI